MKKFDFSKMKEKEKEVIFFLDKGDSFPIKIEVDNPYIQSKEKEIHIVFKEKIYFLLKVRKIYKNTKENYQFLIFLSKNAKEWASVYHMQTIKKIFDLKKNFLSFSFGISKKKGLFGKFLLKTLTGE